jgi:hypothetical protein
MSPGLIDPAAALSIPNAMMSAGIAMLNICTSNASRPQPPKQDQKVRRSVELISRYQRNMAQSGRK